MLLGGCETHHPFAVAVLIVLSRNECYNVVIEKSVNLSIKGVRVGVTSKVSEDSFVLTVVQDALLHRLMDVIILGAFSRWHVRSRMDILG